MHRTSQTLFSLLLLSVAVANPAHAQTVALPALNLSEAGFYEIGESPDIMAKDFSRTGATVYFINNTSGENDGGIKANLAAPYTFEKVGDRIVYSYTLKNVHFKTLGRANAIRSGLKFISACTHYNVGVGAESQDVRFCVNDSGNEFQQGIFIDQAIKDALGPISLRNIRENTTETILQLTLLEIRPNGRFDYKMDVLVENPSTKESVRMACVFPKVKGNTITGVYHVTNDIMLEVDGNEFTVADAALNKPAKVARIPEPSAAPLAFVLAAVAFRKR